MPEAAVLIDSNILIRWVKPDDRDYPLIRSAIEQLIERGSRLCYTSQNIGEFWNACTRPVEFNGFGLSIEEADSRAAAIERTLELLPDTPAVHRIWRELIVRYRVSGAKVHDARLAACMMANDVSSILTLNDKDLTRYSEIEALHPSALLRRLS
jgi:predicted nucleic acid-binding protein